MKAELIAVGSELLRFGRSDTNGEWLTGQLVDLGIEVRLRQIVGDDEEAIAELVRTAMSRVDLVILTGGLGPTADDRTREALARALDLELEVDPEQLRKLEELYARYGHSCRPDQQRQAWRPRGGGWIDNPVGSAAGLLLEREGATLIALPGVPAEMKAMFAAGVVPRIAGGPRPVLMRRTLKIAGRVESSVDRRVRDLYDEAGVSVTILSGTAGIELHLQAAGEDAAASAARLSRLETRMRERLGEDVYGADEETLPSVVGRLLTDARRTVATAESCTGGLLGAAITDVPGSSRWYRGGLVVYADGVKQSLAAIDPELLRNHGAVSEPVARALAGAARERCAADIGVGITGIAGPSGGSEDKPVGLVHLAIEDASDCLHWDLRLGGDRSTVRERVVTIALDRLRRRVGAGG